MNRIKEEAFKSDTAVPEVLKKVFEKTNTDYDQKMRLIARIMKDNFMSTKPESIDNKIKSFQEGQKKSVIKKIIKEYASSSSVDKE